MSRLHRLTTAVLVCFFSAILHAAEPSTTWQTLFQVSAPATQTLRGFGRVESEFTGLSRGPHRVWTATFRCETPEKAAVVAGKFLADLDLSPSVQPIELKLAAQSIPAVTTSTGSIFIVAIQGSQARILTASSQASALEYLKANPQLAIGAVKQASYPMYLDRFDRYGWGVYGFDGYRSTHDWMNVAAKLDNKPGLKDPLEDFEWMVKLNTRFEPHLDPAIETQHSDGMIANADDDWSVKLAREKNLPVSFRLYGSGQSAYHGWVLRRFGEYQTQPADFLPPSIGSYAESMMLSWSAPDMHRYQAVKAAQMIRKYVDQPHVLGWMHPYGEIQVGTWNYDHADYSSHAQNSWRQFLQAQGCDLTETSRLYDRPVPFGDWSQVQLPEFATFAGLDGQVLSLGGKWWARTEVPLEEKIDDAWWQQSPEQRYRGLTEGWSRGPIDGTQWQLVDAPGGGGLPRRFSLTCTTWFRRSFTLTSEQLKQTPVYLYWFPMSRDMIHSGPRARYNGVYVNGQKAGDIGSWGALDVSKLLRAGDNEVSLHLHGSAWLGRIFLSTEQPRMYPALSPGKNRLYNLWRQWLLDTPIKAINDVTDGMRQADPDRPIKIMAPIHLGPTRYVKMASEWGLFPHFTGEGMWYFPWYKRYSFLYDVPASSETAQPAPSNDPRCGEQFDSFRRVFMAGLNAHDPVFWIQTYSRSPYLRKWWEDRQAVLQQLGRYDLFGPQVLLYRSDKTDSDSRIAGPYPMIGDAARSVQSAWNWDIGRGTLQTLGHSYLYLDEQGIADGKMNNYRVMFDIGNEIMTPETCRRIAQWVEAGGTFITLPFTGRSDTTSSDSWPIRALTGCDVQKIRPIGQGNITIARDQQVLRAHAGKVFPDQGTSMDWVGNELNKYSVELKPGADCTVVATYDNGQAAVVHRKLGRGNVIAFGSAFWRNAQDVKGLWWPKDPETQIIGDLLESLGQQPLCETDGNLIWPQPFRSNNGLDLVTVLTSWNEDRDVTTTLKLRLPTKPTSLVSFGVDGEKQLPFEWKDGQAITKVQMPAREVKVIRALGVVEPMDSISHWWSYQQRMWHETRKPALDLKPYTVGKYADPALDLRPDARFSTEKPADSNWVQPEFDDQSWTSSPLSLFRFWGAPVGQPLWVRKSFTVPSEWRKRPGQFRLVVSDVNSPHRDQPIVRLNGTPVEKFATMLGGEIVNVDVTAALHSGSNVLTFEYPGKKPVQAVQGEVYLYHRPDPVRSIPLKLQGEQLVLIPLEWKDKYRIILYMEGERYAISTATVNGKLLGRQRPQAAPAEFNLAAYLKFGQENHILVNSAQGAGKATICRLDLFPLDE